MDSLNSCRFITYAYDVTTNNFLAWNPSLDLNMTTCTLQPGYSYCAVLDDSYFGPNLWLGYAYCVKGSATTTTATTTSVSPTQTGIAANCDEYHTVVSGDSCAAIEDEYGITFAQLYEWNPAIGSNCETLDVGYAVCVGVSS